MGAEVEGEYRKDVYELPIAAIREMIANAVLHRSYLDKSCVQVSIFDDRLEVSSPGMLYGGLDLQTAKMGKSNCRNEAIAEAFHYMHIAEAWGTGLPRIINRCKAYGLPDPLFEEFGDGFKATVYRKVGNDSEKVGNDSEKVGNDSEKVGNDSEKVGNAPQKVGNEPEKVGNDFEKYTDILKKSGISDVFIRNIEQVYCECGMGVVFGQTNVMVWLNCSKAKATNVMNAMKKAKIVKKVSGLGPGKYEFVEM